MSLEKFNRLVELAKSSMELENCEWDDFERLERDVRQFLLRCEGQNSLFDIPLTEPTVKQVLEKAYNVPLDDCTCHLVYATKYYLKKGPCVWNGRVVYAPYKGFLVAQQLGGETVSHSELCPDNPDISDRPAYSYVGVFGKQFDKALTNLRLDGMLVNNEKTS